MALLQAIKQAFARPTPAPAPAPRPPGRPEALAGPVVVPEIDAVALMVGRGQDRLLLLDCREEWERRQGYIPGSQHIVMREIPYRLDELDREADIVVVCAHGNRSFVVSGYLIQKGFRARSLRGGIVDWQARGGAIEASQA